MLDELKVEMQLRGFSKNTIDAYLRYNRKFLEFVDGDPNEAAVKSYLASQIEDGKSAKTVALIRAALLFHLNEIKGMKIDVKAPKLEKKLPSVLSKDEVRALIDNAGAEKSRLMIRTLYSTGLRVSELVALTPQDIDAESGFLTVRSGKGKKMRKTVIDRRLALELLDQSDEHVFEGPVSTRR